MLTIICCFIAGVIWGGFGSYSIAKQYYKNGAKFDKEEYAMVCIIFAFLGPFASPFLK